MLTALESFFPGLRNIAYRVTSPENRDYNCVAWAANITTQWWWPDPDNPAVFWPAVAPLEETVPAFIAAFANLGFQPCAEVTPDAGFEFIAIFAQPDGTPTHAARQLANGNWTSKLGNQVDIEHPLDAICGHLYGQVVQYLRRPSHQ